MSSYYGLILVSLTFMSGIIWLVDALAFAPKRNQALKKLYDDMLKPPQEAVDAVTREPVLVDYAKSFFPILLFIVVVRSFLYEPFQIPSASMKPTLIEGDFILVNKYNYGLRMPVTGTKFWEIDKPKRGDVMVFKAPFGDHDDYIKRVVGLPGDTVIYDRYKELYIIPYCAPETEKQNCPKKIHASKKPLDEPYFDVNPHTGQVRINRQFIENLDGVEHGILNNPDQYSRDPFTGRVVEMRFEVPENAYFVLGDNRDNSNDSRFWQETHFVPEENIVGQAVAIWMHLEFGIKNKYFSWIPTGIKIDRIGAIR